VVAVADGVIREVEKRVDHDVGDCLYISTFMNIHNVHVNRAPVDGTVIARKHQSGTHLPAFTKESKRNEHQTLLLETSHGPMKIVLIAGTLARRIVAYVDVDAVVSKGDRISMIRLGSRVDIYLPVNDTITCTVTKGQWVKAGVDSLAEIND
jgi:phosphatidylserine decarboxylase